MQPDMNQEDYVSSIRRGEIKPERAGRYWTDDEREQLKELYQMGKSITELMIPFQRYENAILQQLGALHLLEPIQIPRDREPETPKCKCRTCKVKDCPSRGKENCCA